MITACPVRISQGHSALVSPQSIAICAVIPWAARGGRYSRRIPDEVIKPSYGRNSSDAKELENRNAEHACLVVEDRTVDLVGTIGRYVVNAKTRSALCSFGNTLVELSLETLPALIDELKALGRLGNTFNVGNEMW